VIAALVLLLSAAPSDDAFKPWVEKDGASISIARTERKEAPWIRGTKTLDARCEEVAAVLTDWSAYAKTFAPVVKKAEVLESGERHARLHLVWPYPWPLRSRDAVVRYEVSEEGDGSGVTAIRWRADAREGDPKRAGVRIETVEGSTMLVPEGERCTVVYTYLGDLGGDFGKSGNEKAWKGQAPHYFESIEKALLARTKRP